MFSTCFPHSLPPSWPRCAYLGACLLKRWERHRGYTIRERPDVECRAKGEKPKNLCNKCCSSFKSINGHGTLPLSSPSLQLRGELSARPSYGYCFSTFCSDIQQHRYLCKPSSTCFRPVFALRASFAAAAGIPLLLFARQVNVNQIQVFPNPGHDALQGFIMKK